MRTRPANACTAPCGQKPGWPAEAPGRTLLWHYSGCPGCLAADVRPDGGLCVQRRTRTRRRCASGSRDPGRVRDPRSHADPWSSRTVRGVRPTRSRETGSSAPPQPGAPAAAVRCSASRAATRWCVSVARAGPRWPETRPRRRLAVHPRPARPSAGHRRPFQPVRDRRSTRRGRPVPAASRTGDLATRLAVRALRPRAGPVRAGRAVRACVPQVRPRRRGAVPSPPGPAIPSRGHLDTAGWRPAASHARGPHRRA